MDILAGTIGLTAAWSADALGQLPRCGRLLCETSGCAPALALTLAVTLTGAAPKTTETTTEPLVDWSRYRDQLAALASEKIGRQLSFDDLSIEPSLTPLVRVRGLEVADTKWAAPAQLATVDELQARIDLLQLVAGKLVLSDVKLVGPTVNLERDAQGDVNWQIGPEQAGHASILPVIKGLEVDGGTVSLDDRSLGRRLAADITSASGQLGENQARTPRRPRARSRASPSS